MGKKLISTKMKLFMLALFLLSITLYASGCIVLAQSGYKLSDYSNELHINPNSFKFDVNLFDFNNSSISKEYPINNNISEIMLDLNSQDIKVENYEGQTLKVQIKSNSSTSSELLETEDGNKLILSAKYDTPSDATITLSIPNSFNNNRDALKLVTSSGDIQISNLSLDSLNISTASGHTKVSNLNLNYFSSDSSSGDSHLKLI